MKRGGREEIDEMKTAEGKKKEERMYNAEGRIEN